MLNHLLQHIGEWCCSVCSSNSNQPAAIFREVKKEGYKFESTGSQRWGKEKYCEKCGTTRTHYKLLSEEPEFSKKERISINPKSRKRILALLENRDAFTGARIASVPEIDHKTPWTRMTHDVDSSRMTDEEIKKCFQLLTREHNLLKDRACSKCKEKGVRPPFLKIPFWYEGDEHYTGTCEGCGWYDGNEWRARIAKIIKNEDQQR